MAKALGTQWVNPNGGQLKHGFRIIQTRQIFEIEETTNCGITWLYRATADDIFEAVLTVVRWTDEAYAETLK